MSKYVVKLTMEQAKRLGIVVCANCGYPANNHFSVNKLDRLGRSACAHAMCEGYKPLFKVGKPIE